MFVPPESRITVSYKQIKCGRWYGEMVVGPGINTWKNAVGLDLTITWDKKRETWTGLSLIWENLQIEGPKTQVDAFCAWMRGNMED